MKRVFMGLLQLGIILILVACGGNAEETNKNDSKSSTTDGVEAVEVSNEDESPNEDTAEVLEPENDEIKSMEDSQVLIDKENLLDGVKKISHPDQEIEISYEEAFFSMEVKPTGDNPSDIHEIIAKDKEIYFHIIASIYNDTTKSFSFGNALGDAKLKLIYDEKHEFDFVAAAENKDGTEFTSSSAEPLTETIAHYYAQIPIAVYETEKALELKVSVGDEEYSISLR